MSATHIEELPAAIQAKILQQISVSDKLSPTPVLASEMNQVADAVIQGVNDFAKILPQIVTLREYFETAERDSANRLRTPIKNCRTWTEFCQTHLGENIRTIQRLLKDVNKKPRLDSGEPEESAHESMPPQKNTEAFDVLQRRAKDAIELQKLFDKSVADVSCDNNVDDGFHVTLHSLTSEQVKMLAKDWA